MPFMMNLPNQLTLLRILLTPVFVFFFFIDDPVMKTVSFFVFTIASLTDWYDGYFARKTGNVSQWGRFLDPLADKILISSAFIGFSVIGMAPTWMVLIIVIRDFLITILRSYAIMKGRPIVTHVIAKAKTVGQFVVLFLVFLIHLIRIWNLAGMEQVLAWIDRTRLVNVLMLLVTGVTVFTGLLYLVQNRSHLRHMTSDVARWIASIRS
jgi:CDP-diacylglycerol--glycerol-3-phosphate 3-phosphatidyltransferase